MRFHFFVRFFAPEKNFTLGNKKSCLFFRPLKTLRLIGPIFAPHPVYICLFIKVVIFDLSVKVPFIEIFVSTLVKI